MAYGAFNVGSGASTYDLDKLAAEVISGCVSAPLTTVDGLEIATRGGSGIGAFLFRTETAHDDDAAVTAAVAGIVRMVELNRQECLAGWYGLAADIIRGTVSAPLTTRGDSPIHDRGGRLLFAYQVRGDDRSYADAAIAKAFAELSATIERYQAQNIEAVQSLIAGIVSGQFPAPLADAEGTGITANNGANIAAVKNL